MSNSMSAVKPTTASDRIDALKELRPLLATLKSKFSRHALSTTVAALEEELRKDAAELRALSAEASTDEVKSLLSRQEAMIETALSRKEDVVGVEEPAAKAEKKQPDKKPQPAPSPPPPKPAAAAKPTMPPLVTTPKIPSMDSPPGGLDPHAWPLATDTDLPPECWRATQTQPMRQVPRCPYGSKAARTLLEQRKPVILTHSPVVASAAGKWKLDYLSSNLKEVPCTVYASRTRHFRYWDDEKNDAGYALPETERTEKLKMAADEFKAKVREAAAAAGEEASGGSPVDVSDGASSSSSRWHYYLQTALVEGVGSELSDDFGKFDWSGILALQRKLGWEDLTSNLLLIGERLNTTPAHYDEQQNLFAQLDGKKRCILFAPSDFVCLYPFPLHHPCDRQAQVDLYAPDLSRFPRFAEARPLEAVLEPGELLYIPQYWFHHIENLSHECVSLNFWFKDQSRTGKVELPLSDYQQLAMRRNIEKLVAAELGAGEAQKALALLASNSNAPETADVKRVRKEIKRLLSHVMSEDEVPKWLDELVVGRFDGLTPLADGKVV